VPSFDEVLRGVRTAAGGDFTIDEHEAEKDGRGYGTICLSTRDYGNVGEETPGAEDIKAGHALIARIERECPNVRGTLETVDEWTNVEFSVHGEVLGPRPPGPKARSELLMAFSERITEMGRTHGWRRDDNSRGEIRLVNGPEWDSPSFEVSLAVEYPVPPGGRRQEYSEESDKKWFLALQLGDVQVELPTNRATGRAVGKALEAAYELSAGLEFSRIRFFVGAANGTPVWPEWKSEGARKRFGGVDLERVSSLGSLCERMKPGEFLWAQTSSGRRFLVDNEAFADLQSRGTLAAAGLVDRQNQDCSWSYAKAPVQFSRDWASIQAAVNAATKLTAANEQTPETAHSNKI
jgi:hypothetical protein